MLTTALLGLAVVAAIGGASAVYIATSHRTRHRAEQRRRTRDWRRDLRHLHSGHIDGLPRTGGPSDEADRP